MCDEYNQRPIGTAEVEQVWYEYQRKAREAATNDIYTNGGLLDSSNGMGFQVMPPYGAPVISRDILENYFSYSELKFISNARLLTMTAPDVDKLIMLLKRFKQTLEVKGLTMGQGTNGTPNYFIPQYNSNVQPLYGCPIPQEQRNLNAKWEKDLWTRKWGNLGEESGFDFPKDNEEKLYSPGTPFPEKIGEKKDSHKSTVVLSAEGISSETEDETEKKQKEFTEMVYRSASEAPGVEPPGSKSISSLKAILDYPSTGIEINKNPVPLTTDEKDSVDKNNEED